MTAQTRRQRIVELLLEGEWTFDELRRELGVPVAVLAEDLKHVSRSARHLTDRPRSLEVSPARCRSCGHLVERRRGQRFGTPSRCPRCRAERLEPPQLSLR